jgi:hypothetical protein
MAGLVRELRQACATRNLAELLSRIASVVPEYVPSPEIVQQCRAESSGEQCVAESLARLSRVVKGERNSSGALEPGGASNLSGAARG